MSGWRSTRDSASSLVSASEAIQAGLAPDGGLFVPAAIPRLSSAQWHDLRGRSLPDVATALMAALVDDSFDPARLRGLVGEALDFDVPLVPLAEGLWVLELFHGPTLAFKDFGARTMARWLAALQDHAASRPLTVLVATSGDTGGAVADAFFGVPGTRVVVLYPHGRVSRVQEVQFATLGGNVTAVAVEGTFDDCQRLVKEAFADRSLAAAHRLTSANSINVGRLLPQMAYYAWAVLQLPLESPPPTVVVPSGNLGNLTAGVMASRRGVPVRHFVAATTINDPFPRYLQSGAFTPAAATPTPASAMDVGAPSNFERLTWLFDGDVARMRESISGDVVSNDDIFGAMRELHTQYGYVADPHTAVGYVAARRAGWSTAAPVVVLATAHPSKFPEVVGPAIGVTADLPPALAARLDAPLAAVRAPARLSALADVLSTR